MKTRPYREPLAFKFNYLWATSNPFKYLILATLVLVFSVVATVIVALIIETNPIFSSQTISSGTSALIGVLVGGLISGGVSYFLQRDEFKGESLLSKRKRIYEPLFDGLLDLIRILERQPFPSFISPSKGDLIHPSPGLVGWYEISSDERILHVPNWLKNSFESFVDEILQYNQLIVECNQFLGSKMEDDLIEKGLIESAEAFGDSPLILAEAHSTRTITPFGTMNYGSLENKEEYERLAPTLIPELFREYGTLEKVKELRLFYKNTLLFHAKWLSEIVGKIIRLIEFRYGSASRII